MGKVVEKIAVGALVVGFGVLAFATLPAGLGFLSTVGKFGLLATTSAILARRPRIREDNSLRAGETVVLAPRSPQIVCYGERMVGGNLLYRDTARADSSGEVISEWWMVIAHAAHVCEDITDIELDGDQYGSGDITWTGTGNGDSATFDAGGSSKWAPVNGIDSVKVWKYLGDHTATLAELSSQTEWTSAHVAQGWCVTIWRLRAHAGNQDLFAGGHVPRVRVKLKGKKVYNSAEDTNNGGSGPQRVDQPTTWTWSESPVLAVSDYMREYMGISDTRIDWPTEKTSVTTCDTLVEITTASPASTEKRYTCNGILSLTDGHKKNLDGLLSSMVGSLARPDGKWQILAGAYTTPTVTITDADILREPEIQWRARPPIKERMNKARATYVSRDDAWQDVESVARAPSAFLTRDNNRVRDRVFPLPFTDHETEAQRILDTMLDQANQMGILTVPLRWTGLQIAPGVGVTLTYTPFGAGFSSKIFRCIGLTVGGTDAPVVAVLKEDASTAWDDTAPGDYVTRTFGAALTPTDPAVFNDLPDPSDLYAFFPLDRATAADQRAATAITDGTMSGTITKVVGPAGDAINLSDVNDNVILLTAAEHNALHNGNTNDPFAISMWFRSTSTSGSGYSKIFGSHLVTGVDAGSYGVFINNSLAQGSQELIIGYWNGSSFQAPSSGVNARASAWNHLALVRVNTGTLRLFVNGNLAQEVTTFVGATDTTNDQFSIGQPVSPTNGAAGDYALVRFYTEAITAVQARALFENPGSTEGVGVAQLGESVYDEAGNLLDDIDVRNDEAILTALSALNHNAGFGVPRKNQNGTGSILAPHGWYGYNATAADSGVRYLDASTRDVLRVTEGDVSNSYFRVNPGRQYEVVAVARDDTSTSSDVDIEIHELDANPAQSVTHIIASGSTNSANGAQFGTRSLTVIDNMSMTTTWQTYTGTYTPTATAIVASLGINSNNRRPYFDYILIRDQPSAREQNLVLKINTNPDDGAADNQEIALVAVHADGTPKWSNSGWITYNGTRFTIPWNDWSANATTRLMAVSQRGFFACDTTGTFTVGGVAVAVAGAWKDGVGDWYYDNQGTTTAFTPDDEMCAIGWFETDSSGIPVRAGLFGNVVALTLAVFPNDDFYAGANEPDLGGLITNSSMRQVDNERNRPASWWAGNTTATDTITRVIESGNPFLRLGSATDSQITALSSAFPLDSNRPLKIKWRWRHSGAGATDRTVRMQVNEYDSELGTGIQFISDTDVLPTYDDQFNVARTRLVSAFALADLAAANTWYDQEYDYTPTSTAKWASLEFLNNDGTLGNLDIDRVTAEPFHGALAPKDTVGTDEIDQDAVSIDGFAESTAVDMAFTTYTTVETVDLVVPNPVPAGTTAFVIVDFEWYVEAQPAFTTDDIADVRMNIRLLANDGTTVLKSKQVEMLIADPVPPASGANLRGYQSCSMVVRVPNGNLDTGTNTFALQVDFLHALTNIATVDGGDVSMLAFLRKK